MKQGWETSTLLDVEQLWKQKQQKSIQELPKPRFTQRDIIDKRVYIPSPGARYARAKKAKLVRTFSTPSSSQQQHQEEKGFHSFRRHQSDYVEGESSNRINTRKSPLYFHHYNHHSHLSQQQRQYDMDCSQSTCSSSDGEQHTNSRYDQQQSYSVPTPPMRNSLDFLSYAIAMTEEARRDQDEEEAPTATMITSSQPLPDISKMEPNLMDCQQEKKSSCAKRKQKAREEVTELNVGSSSMGANASGKDTTTDDNSMSSPSSIVFTAAKTIMMFADSHPPPQPQQSSPDAHSSSSLYPPQH